MNSNSIALLIIGIALLAVVLLLARKSGGRSALSHRRSSKEGTLKASPQRMQVPDSPLLRVTFDEAFQSDLLGREIRDYGIKRIAWEFGLDPANIALNAVAFRQGALILQFSKLGQQLLKSGEAIIPIQRVSGKPLGVLQDADTGRFIEIAKGKTAGLINLCQVSAIVISTAHIISSADNLKRLKVIDSKLDYLIRARSLDQHAELKTIYNRSREGVDGELTDHKRIQLSSYRDRLLQLRERWRLEIADLIEHAPQTRMNVIIEHIPLVGKSVQKTKDRELLNHLNRTVPLIRHARLALFTDACLALHLGESQKLIEHVVQDEARSWSLVLSSFTQKAATIRGHEHYDSIKILQENVDSQVSILSSMAEGVPIA
jgi:hypothetical protein